MSLTTEFKEGKAKIKAVYYTSKTLADGSHPFLIRITKDGQRKYIATGLSLHPKYWNDKYTGYADAIRRNYPESEKEKLIRALDKLEKKFAKSAEELTESDEQHDAKAVAAKANESRKQTSKIALLAYADTLVEKMNKAGQRKNARVYKDTRNQLAKYIKDEYGVDDISFDKVTPKFCYEWEMSLRASGNIESTLSNRFRTLRAILNKAISGGCAKVEKYPFARSTSETHKFTLGKFDTTTQKRSVSRDAVRLIESYQPVGTATTDDFKGIRNPGAAVKLRNRATIEHQQLAKDIFVLSFYMGGINFIDLANLRWQDIWQEGGDHHLNYERSKTGAKLNFKILPPAVAIIERYKAEYIRDGLPVGPDEYILPILNRLIHRTPDQIDNRLDKVLKSTNKALKGIGKAVGVPLKLTTYVARHAMAMTLRRSGKSDAVISEVMAQKDEKSVKSYLDKFGSPTVNDALNALL